jgi:hypothetical protein
LALLDGLFALMAETRAHFLLGLGDLDLDVEQSALAALATV